MIFVTVGSMLPFDRLIASMDQWAASNPGQEVFAQIGQGTYQPKSMTWAPKVTPAEFKALVSKADLIVAHAGMGSIITALERQKAIVIVPRKAALAEHTSDHQIHTARWFQRKAGIHVAMSEAELPALIEAALGDTSQAAGLSDRAPVEFTARIRDFVLHGDLGKTEGQALQGALGPTSAV